MKILYEVENDNGVQKRELPFVIGVLADFTGHPLEPLPRLRDRRFVEVTADNFDELLSSLRPHLAFTVAATLSPDPDGVRLKVDLTFRSMNDFDPHQVARQVGPLRSLLDERSNLKELWLRLTADPRLEAVVHCCLSDPATMRLARTQIDHQGQEQSEDGPSAIAAILEACGWTDNPWSAWMRDGIADRLARLLSYLTDERLPYSRDPGAILAALISNLERVISKQLDGILQEPEFKRLEAAWRGLAYLFERTRDLPQVKLKILNVNRKELLRDLQRAPEFDHSSLFKRVYNEFGTLGGEPFSILVGDYEFSHYPEDVEMLEKIAQVAAVAHCPFLAALAPLMLQLQSFVDLELPRSLIRVFESCEYAKWNSFRQSDDSRYVCLAMPRILLRRPHEVNPAGLEATLFYEYHESVCSASDLLWGNAAFALAANLAEGFAKTDFASAAIGYEAGGMVSGLPLWSAVSDEGETVSACPTEIAITDGRQAELSDLGFVALCQRKGNSEAVFFDLPTCCEHRTAHGNVSSALQSRLSAQLENILVANRFAHYIKCILRDKVGNFKKLPEWEAYLDSWIKQYVARDLESGTDGYRPLTSGAISIEPTYWRAPGVIATLSPRFRNRSGEAALRIVVSLPQMEGLRQ